MNRKGYDEQTWFTFSYSPVRDESGKVAGMFCAVLGDDAESAARTRGAARAERDARAPRRRRRSPSASSWPTSSKAPTRSSRSWTSTIDGWPSTTRRPTSSSASSAFVRGSATACSTCSRRSPSIRRAVQAVWSRALAGEEFTAIEEFGDPARDRRAYEMRFNTLRDRDGHRIGAYQFVYDVTERLRDQERLRNAEAALRQAQKMESLGQLTGGVAHDFNNLLAVFASGLQLLERMPGASPPAARLRRHAPCGRTRHRPDAAPAGLLAPPAGEPGVDRHRRPPEGHARDARRVARRAHRGRRCTSAPGLWPVEVDAGEMELAILNLCVNARDAMTDGGVITIAVENAAGGGRTGPRAEFVKISVADTGCRHAARGAGARLRAVLHDQGRQQGIGARPAAGVWLRATIGRARVDRQRGRRRHDRDAAPAAIAHAIRSAPLAPPTPSGVPAPKGDRRAPRTCPAGRRRQGGVGAHA